MNPVEVPQIIKQVPLPRIEGISKSMKTLLEKMPEENIIKNCILHMIEEGKSILRASKETGLSYNAVHEIVYGKKHPGGTQYTHKDDPLAHKHSIRKSTNTSK